MAKRNDPTSSAQDEAHLIQTIKALIERGEKAEQKAKDFFIAAGQHLKTLHDIHKERGGTWAEWETLVKEKCGIGKSRASELMQIADGRKTNDEVRAGTSHRQQEHRDRLRYNGESRAVTTAEVKTKLKVDEPRPEVLAQRAASAGRIRGLLGDDRRDVGDAEPSRRQETYHRGGSGGAGAAAEQEIGARSPGEVQRLQERISELEAALNRRDIKIAGLEKEVRHLLQVRKTAAADDELSDRLTAKFNAAKNKPSKVQRSEGFDSIVNDIVKSGCLIRILAKRPKVDQSADQDPAPAEAPIATSADETAIEEAADTVRCAS
jgi:hypothetical protein